jgi:hypothetical protein
MRNLSIPALAGAVILLLAGCATKDGWMGAEAEKAYDKDLEIKRLASVLNNDDYYEFEKDGRIYVLSDAKDYTGFKSHGEITFSTKKIGGGPGGKTIIYGLVKKETELLAKDPKAQGAAQKMFEGNLKGLEKGFFGMVEDDGRYYVFSSWGDLQSYKSKGSAKGESAKAPDGKSVTFVVDDKQPATALADTKARFGKLFEKK